MTILDLGTILEFDDLLNRLTELRKAILFIALVYYSDRALIKVSKAKRCRGQNPRETKHELLVVFFQWSSTDRA